MASAQDSTALLQQAADAYSNGDYQTAIDQYEQVLAGGQDAFEVYYNLVVVLFKNSLNRSGHSKLRAAARLNN
ncbi:MAG: hypothetical protein R2825_09070 [Saprospiraceae bacterium]